MQHAPQQLTDQEFNLGWVFSQLLALDVDRPLSSEGAGDPHHDGKPPTAKKRRSINQQTEFSEPNSNHAQLTAAHIKHVFDAMKVQLSTDEAEEVLSLMDDNQDGRVTIEDFWQTMKGQEREREIVFAPNRVLVVNRNSCSCMFNFCRVF